MVLRESSNSKQKIERVAFRIESSLLRKVKILAKRNKITVSAYVRLVLQESVQAV